MKPTVPEMFERAMKRVGFRLRRAGAITLLEAAPAPRRAKAARNAKRNGRAQGKR